MKASGERFYVGLRFTCWVVTTAVSTIPVLKTEFVTVGDKTGWIVELIIGAIIVWFGIY